MKVKLFETRNESLKKSEFSFRKTSLRKLIRCLMPAIAVFSVLSCAGGDPEKNPPDSGLILYCPFEGTLQSAAGLKPEAREFGEIKYEEGLKGKALKLTRESYVDLPVKGILPEQTGTIGFWIKPNWHELNPSTPPTYRYHFLSKLPIPEAGAKDANTFAVYYWNTPRAIVCSFIPGKERGKIMNLDPAWRSESWNYIAVTWGKGKSCKIYVNGNASPQLKGNEENPVVGPADAIRLGRMSSNITDVSLDGLIDELKIWDRALSPDEIQGQYEQDVITAGLSKAVRKVRPDAEKRLNLKTDFGAKGDGITDDTQSLQNAIDCRQNILIPVGVYRLTKTLRLRSYCNLCGSGGGPVNPQEWNDNGKTILRYDGPEDGIVMLADQATSMQLSDFTIDGHEKAGIGLKITASYEIFSEISDLTITRTMNDALYVATMGVTTFERIYAYRNYGNGITLGSYPNKDPGDGSVNSVTFAGCVANYNGMSDKYDGVTNIATGYGIGLLGNNTVNNIVGCTFERNGGPGIYIGPDRKVAISIRDCYTESNGGSVTRKEGKIYGSGAQYSKTRPPLGITPAILIENNNSNMSSPIIIDNVFINWRNSIWLKGYQEEGEPIRFKNMYKVSAVYAEHGNWEFIDSDDMFIENGNIVKGTDAGIHVRSMPGSFLRTKKTPSGHPGIRVKGGQRQVIPFDAKGITLYVNTLNGDDKNDGRTPELAWKSFGKVAWLFNRSILDTPWTVEIAGKYPVTNMSLSNISGKGTLNLNLAGGVTVKNPSFDNLFCEVNVSGAGPDQLTAVRIASCPSIRFSSLTIFAPSNAVAASIQRKSGAVFLDCRFKGDSNSGTGLYCSGFSEAFLADSSLDGFAPLRGVVYEPGSEVGFQDTENKNGKTLENFKFKYSGKPALEITEEVKKATETRKTGFKEKLFDFEECKQNTEFTKNGWVIKSGTFLARGETAASGHGNILISTSGNPSVAVKENCEFNLTENETDLFLEADFCLEKIPKGMHLFGIGQQAWDIGPRVGIYPEGRICLFGAQSRHVSKETLKIGKWYRLRLVMDLTANPIDDNFVCLNASGSVYLKELSGKHAQAPFVKVSDLQNINLDLSRGMVRPSAWSRLWIISSAPGEVATDNLRVGILEE